MHFTRLTRSLLIRKVVKKVGKSTNNTTVYGQYVYVPSTVSTVQVAPKPARPKPAKLWKSQCDQTWLNSANVANLGGFAVGCLIGACIIKWRG